MNFKFLQKPLFLALIMLSLSNFYSCSKEQVNEDGAVTHSPKNALEIDKDFFLNKEGSVANYIIAKEDYDAFLNSKGDFAKISKKVYEHFEDDFDFIFILSNEKDQPDGLYYGVTHTAKNDVKGTGSVIYDRTAEYGSAGKLKSIIHMPRTEYIKNGPFLHEIMHYWGNYDFLETQEWGHWGYSSVGGQLGGFDEIVSLGNNTYVGKMNGENGFGTNANGGNSIGYGNAELYIMGLIGADELEDIKIAKNANRVKYGEFTADEIVTLTANEIITKNGERVPSVETSQKEFKAITIVISKEALSEEKMKSVHNNIENFSRKAKPEMSWGNTYNFWMATKEKATLDIKIPKPKK